MKLQQVHEESIPIVFASKNVNSLNKKPKKLKKGVYGIGGGPVVGHSDSCGMQSGDTCTCGAVSAASGAGAGAGSAATGGAGAGGAGGTA